MVSSGGAIVKCRPMPSSSDMLRDCMKQPWAKHVQKVNSIVLELSLAVSANITSGGTGQTLQAYTSSAQNLCVTKGSCTWCKLHTGGGSHSSIADSFAGSSVCP